MSIWRILWQVVKKADRVLEKIVLLKLQNLIDRISSKAELQAEFEVWERASDEALINFENVLDDNTFDTPSAVGTYNG